MIDAENEKMVMLAFVEGGEKMGGAPMGQRLHDLLYVYQVLALKYDPEDALASDFVTGPEGPVFPPAKKAPRPSGMEPPLNARQAELVGLALRAYLDAPRWVMDSRIRRTDSLWTAKWEESHFETVMEKDDVRSDYV